MGSQGYITATGGTATGFSGDKYTDYIAIVPGQKYGWTAYFSDARCIAMYDANKVLIRTISGTAAGNPSYYEFVAGGNEYFFRGSAYGQPNPPKLERVPYTLKDKIIKLEADLLAATPNAAVDYEYNAPAYIFASDNDSSGFYSRDYVQHLYPDSLLRAKLDMSLDDARAVNVQSHVKNVATKENVAMTHVLGGNGYKDKTFAYNLVKTKASNAKNKAIRYLAIGDSMTANNIAQTDGVLRGGGCYNAIVKELAMMDNIDMGDNSIKVALIGTGNRTDNPPATYKGQSISIRNCAEGRGSWCTVNYLRHMLHTITSGSTTTSFAGVDAWDSLGLGRKIAIDGTYDEGVAYETYTGTNAQKLLIAQTPHGKYHWDYTANLWAWLDAKYAEVSGAYAGSAEQKTLIDTKMNYLMDNPSNPFFDKAVAKATGDYAFSLTKYLARYKTLADDGVTRLVVGSTAGSHVTDATAYDVCTPTHITLEVGENDRWHFGGVMTAQLTADDNLKIMNAIAAEYPAIKAGFITTRMMGPMFPEKWSDVADVSPMSVGSNEFKYDMNKIVQTALGTLASQTTKYFIPTYFTHSLTSFSSTRKDIDLETGKEVSVGGTDINHPGIQCYWSMAYQILAWIYYTL
ncbi:Hypothetical protein TFLO_1785 [Trichococcus flocculiformis]|uniref:SGNH hydrolase-type esterase domain-containing protein n=2 Tax=Trichococcus flocculiformis TaxID=82803 RepID=A0AB38BKV6_9LACT|nr:Hypothetical protein TFLO_1785 [Trichococcus flocculiformis]SFI12124.1 hypothetical protein SAMN04488507_10549 [Trichococcus flocculiformis]